MKKHTQIFAALTVACASLLATQANAATASITWNATLTSGCTIPSTTVGTLAFDSLRTTMGTEVTGGARSSVSLMVIGNNVSVSLSAPTVTVAGTADTNISGATAQLFSASTGGTATYTSGGTALTVSAGSPTYYVGFTIPRSTGAWGAAGAHVASTTLTCA